MTEMWLNMSHILAFILVSYPLLVYAWTGSARIFSRSKTYGFKNQLKLKQSHSRLYITPNTQASQYVKTNDEISMPSLQPKIQNSIVIIAGFEKFNFQLYKRAIFVVNEIYPDVKIYIYTDTDINDRPQEVEKALASSNVLLCSLIFDYFNVKWIKQRIVDYKIPSRFCFESALELMSENSVGQFNMKSTSTTSSAGMPAPIKIIFNNLLGTSNREEDKLAGYLKLLKIGPKLLNWLPPNIGTGMGKLSGLRTWITVYSFWTESGVDNIVSMLKTIITDFRIAKLDVVEPLVEPLQVKETPPQGLFHPMLKENNIQMTNPREYVDWYLSKHPWVNALTPRVGILLYRKHVISEQGYIGNLINLMENEGLMPIPVYINGVEGHTIVRDYFTSNYELSPTFPLQPDAVVVDAVVNTIGFPLVGGPAGSMEGGRGIDAAREILQSKNIPYFIAAPLLIQDLESWQRSGVQGLQTVVLYSLPELDGAIETIVLGGLVGDKIVIIPERTRKLCSRIKAWVALRKSQAEDRKIAIMVYGFPPNVGAVGTAALLNVGKSFENLLYSLASNGYNIGRTSNEIIDGDAIVKALKYLSNELTTTRPLVDIQHTIDNLFTPVNTMPMHVLTRDVSHQELSSWLGKKMTSSMEGMWGSLESFAGFGSSNSPGSFKVIGLQFGNIFLAVQPLLGIEGDPMRLLFERNLTPHPQYAAFYLWLKNCYNPSSIVHFGMHGTVEWLPGSPLGSTAESWPDILLGSAPNIYIYACNNPSESLLAKRRGYATVVSHNVPPYSRSGLYKELQALREILTDYRSPMSTSGTSSEGLDTARIIIPLVFELANNIGLFEDLPFHSTTFRKTVSDVETVNEILSCGNENNIEAFVMEFNAYSEKLWSYMSELENRLFSEGLHVIGEEYSAANIKSYLNAVLDLGPDNTAPELSDEALQIIAEDLVRGKSTSATINRLFESKSSSMHGHALMHAHAAVSTSMLDSVREFLDLDTSYLTGSRSGIYFSDLFSVEDRYALSLLLGKGDNDDVLGRVRDFMQFQRLKLARDFGFSKRAEGQINDLLALAVSGTNRNRRASSDKRNLVKEALELSEKLIANPKEELSSLVRAIGGQYVPAAPGGDIVRDGVDVLPTGRNIYSLDPYRIPSQVATLRGKAIADAIIADHVKSTGGIYPQTVSVNLWGLDTIKTRGEAVGIVLGLIGAVPVREMTGRVVAFELVPLDELQRPRIDVLGTMSGIFRDSFGNVLDLLDDVFERASKVTEESVEMNFIKKHTEVMRMQGVDRPYSRLFSNPPGDFGSLVNEQIGSSEWDKPEELGDIWQKRNAFSYGKSASEKGTARGDVLKSLLNTTDRIVQEIDSVEFGLTDIQEYYANTGALKKAAETVRGPGSNKVNVTIIEAFDRGGEIKPKELEDVLRMEYRTKLLNPRWSTAMLKQGAGGVYEISGRMTALIGWAGTAGFQDKWVFDGAAERYVLDEEVARQMREQNPEAFRNIVKRMMEASGRGFWRPDKKVLDRIREVFDDIDDEMEAKT